MRLVVSKMSALAAVVGLLMAGGCAHTAVGEHQSFPTPSCHQESAETFVLTGPTNAALAACVAAAFQPTTREVILNSRGGDVSHALDIAEHFEGRRLAMRVRGECNSSCANYFLPLAGQIVVEPGAFVLLHGSIDPWSAARSRNDRDAFVQARRSEGLDEAEAVSRFERGQVRIHALVERQAAFAARNGVRAGWLLYRDVGGDGRMIAGLSHPLAPNGRALLVEESMMRRCLPTVDIAPYQTDLQRHWLRSLRRLGLAWSGIVPSGETVCIDRG